MKLKNQDKAYQLINNLFKIKGALSNVNKDQNSIFINYFQIHNLKINKENFIELLNKQKRLDEKELKKL